MASVEHEIPTAEQARVEALDVVLQAMSGEVVSVEQAIKRAQDAAVVEVLRRCEDCDADALLYAVIAEIESTETRLRETTP